MNVHMCHLNPPGTLPSMVGGYSGLGLSSPMMTMSWGGSTIGSGKGGFGLSTSTITPSSSSSFSRPRRAEVA